MTKAKAAVRRLKAARPTVRPKRVVLIKDGKLVPAGRAAVRRA